MRDEKVIGSISFEPSFFGLLKSEATKKGWVVVLVEIVPHTFVCPLKASSPSFQ